jgi:hypothetical protein
MLEVLEVLLLPSGDGHFGYSGEYAGMVKVLPHLISRLIKIHKKNCFLNWVHSKNWRKTFVVTLWPLLYLLLGNS